MSYKVKLQSISLPIGYYFKFKFEGTDVRLCLFRERWHWVDKCIDSTVVTDNTNRGVWVYILQDAARTLMVRNNLMRKES